MLSKSFEFDSDHLHFRGIRAQDAEIIVEWRGNPENYRFFLDPHQVTLEEHLAWFEKYLYDDSRFDFLIVNAEGTPVGTCGLSSIDGTSCEISYMIGAQDARGKGYAKEAVKRLTDVAFEELGVDFVEARILAQNEASMHVVAAANYEEYERVFRIGRSENARRQG